MQKIISIRRFYQFTIIDMQDDMSQEINRL